MDYKDAMEYGQIFITEAIAAGIEEALTPNEDGRLNSWLLYDWLIKYVNTNTSMFLSSGATRSVICDPDNEYVIKIANNSEDECYNENEVYIYECACEKGYKDYFAGLIKVGAICGRGIYVGEYAQCDEDEIASSVSEYCWNSSIDCGEVSSSEPNYYSGSSSESCEEWALHEWGKIGRSILDFLADCQIDDLHAGNWGYINSSLVVVDYAGFHGECAHVY